MQHDAPLVVVLVTEPAGNAFDLLDDAVVALGPGIRFAQLQESFDLRPPPLNRPRQPALISLSVTPAIRYTAVGTASGPSVEHATWLFIQTGASSRDKVFSEGERTTVTGDVVGIYLFRATTGDVS